MVGEWGCGDGRSSAHCAGEPWASRSGSQGNVPGGDAGGVKGSDQQPGPGEQLALDMPPVASACSREYCLAVQCLGEFGNQVG